MFVFDPYWTYYIGSLLKEFDDLNDGDFLGEHVEGIVSVKSDLKRFVAHEQHRVYREGCQCIEGLLEQIEVLLPSNIPFTDRKLELKKDIKPILEHIRETHKAILRDCQNSYILGLRKTTGTGSRYVDSQHQDCIFRAVLDALLSNDTTRGYGVRKMSSI